jgi:hypothetical protein
LTRWFRFYDDAVNDPKVQRLPGEKFKAWVNLLCLASRNEGVLPPLADIAFCLRMDEEIVSSLLDEFCSLLLLDPVEFYEAPMSYEPHNWPARQYKSDVTDPTAPQRMKRYRDNKRNDRNGTVTVTPTRAETEQKQITETEKKKETREVALSSDFEFEDFWKLWPNKVGKPAALKAFVSARRRAGIDAIVEGVFAYIRDKPPDRSWLNPATFLNQNRWEDKPAQVQNGKTSSISSACDNLVQLVNAGFGRAAPQDDPGSGANEVDARLLSHRGG